MLCQRAILLVLLLRVPCHKAWARLWLLLHRRRLLLVLVLVLLLLLLLASLTLFLLPPGRGRASAQLHAARRGTWIPHFAPQGLLRFVCSDFHMPFHPLELQTLEL